MVYIIFLLPKEFQISLRRIRKKGREFKKSFLAALTITIHNLPAILTLRLVHPVGLSIRIFLMYLKKLSRSVFSVLVWCETHLLWKVFHSVNVCTLKDHVLNLGWKLCQISWKLYKKNDFNVKGKSYSVKAVIICCTDKGKMELIWHFLVNFRFQN